MAYAPHTRVSFGGSLENGTVFDEIWNCNVNVITPDIGGGPLENPIDYLAEIAPNLAVWFGAAASNISSRARLEYVKANSIGANGKYSDALNSNQFDFDTFTIGHIDPIWPGIISIVTSWRTSATRGPGSKGRVYLPNGTVGTAINLILDAGSQASYVTAGKNLLTVLRNNGGDNEALPVVASGVAATNRAIVAVAVGSVIDVQRRRKNALTETYVQSDWP